MRTYCYFVRGAQHRALCETSQESVRRVDPGATFIVQGEEPHLEGLPMMLANLETQCRAIWGAQSTGEELVFLDTDILMLEPLPDMLEHDLMVTWRDYVAKDEYGNPIEGLSVTMPYNYGVLVCKAGYAALEAFIWMRERIRRMNTRLQGWYGNQVALAALCGPRPEMGMESLERAIPWTFHNHGNPVSILKVPGERWNYTPSKAGEPLEGRSVLHFKGHARPLMESYAKRLGLTWHETEKAA